jgi:hypothetical protein
MGRPRDPEPFDLVGVRKTFDLDDFAVHLLVRFPRQRTDAP